LKPLTNIAKLFTVNNVFHIPPERKIQESNMESEGARELLPSSKPTIRNFPVQKGTITAEKVRGRTI
jgi:hypothetical protein